jgi:hypothetical protein
LANELIIIFFIDGIDVFFKLLKLVPLVQEINRKHSEALNTVKMRQPSSAPQSASCAPQQTNTSAITAQTNLNLLNQSNFNNLNLKMNKPA